MGKMNPLWYLDEPNLLKDCSHYKTYTVRGWIASFHDIEGLKVTNKIQKGTSLFELSIYKRPDLKKVLPFRKGIKYFGFKGSCSLDEIKNLPFVTIEFSSGNKDFRIIAPNYQGKGHSKKNKELKLKKLLPFLICPVCGLEQLKQDTDELKCISCGNLYSYNSKNINFLTDELKKKFKIFSTENISHHHYDPITVNFINQYKDGMILDCGAGSRTAYYENVVNFEIVDYESTDVVGVSESLPFKDGTFDGVFSLAVLEHVKDPFKCAEEIKRVIKPGGFLYCQVPFLTPFHAYPNHFYNMTYLGLANLFEGQMAIENQEVLDSGQPIHTINGILQMYLAGLPRYQRWKFKNMKVKDFIVKEIPELYKFMNKPIVTKLDEKIKKQLSYVNYIIAKKN